MLVFGLFVNANRGHFCAQNKICRQVFSSTPVLGIDTIVIVGSFYRIEEAELKDIETETTPEAYSLSQNFPNPFNPNTTIRYEIPVAGVVTIKLYDLLGREVRVLVNEHKPPGRYQVTFDAGTLASGVYYYRLDAGGFHSVKKLVLIR